MATYKLGKDQQLKVETSSGTYTEAKNVKSVTLSRSADEIDTTTRAANGYHTSQPGLKTVSLSFELLEEETSDTVLTALEAAYTGANAIGIQVGSYDADWSITKFDRSEDLDQAVTYSVECSLKELNEESSSSSSSAQT
ncbi:MAG: hypothetical protein J6S75_03195 [Thermoguttaceae bacterium]|nr:hypothetical protein [Thermoguttaceae bacterium]